MRVIELVLLLLAPWPLVRLLTIRPFRRWYPCFALRVAVVLALYGAGLVVLYVWLPRLVPFAAALAALWLVLERWRSRTSYGESAGLPPGRLALVPRSPWTDEAFYRKQAARHGAVFKVSQYLRPMACVIGPRLGLALFLEHGERLGQPDAPFSQQIPRGFIRFMQPADHQEYRPVLQAGLSAVAFAGARTEMLPIVRSALAAMAGASDRPGDSGVHPKAYFEDMLLVALVRVFLGLEPDSDDVRTLLRDYRFVDIRKAVCGSPRKKRESVRSAAEIIRRRAQHLVAVGVSEGSVGSSGAENAHSLLGAILAREPQCVGDETLLLNLLYMIQVGRTDLTGMLVWLLKLLLDNPEWIGRLRMAYAAPGAESGSESDSASLARRVIQETLRLEQSEFLFRRVTKDIRFEGFVLPKGWLVRVCIRDGHRDPKVFDHPDRFDPDRFLGRTYSREEYCPLGLLRHACLGGQLIDLVGTCFLEELVPRYGIDLLRDGPREYGFAHWEPSSNMRIRLRRLD